jgi:hypothetical protein
MGKHNKLEMVVVHGESCDITPPPNSNSSSTSIYTDELKFESHHACTENSLNGRSNTAYETQHRKYEFLFGIASAIYFDF